LLIDWNIEDDLLCRALAVGWESILVVFLECFPGFLGILVLEPVIALALLFALVDFGVLEVGVDANGFGGESFDLGEDGLLIFGGHRDKINGR
jgi:hypothetical protein